MLAQFSTNTLWVSRELYKKITGRLTYLEFFKFVVQLDTDYKPKNIAKNPTCEMKFSGKKSHTKVCI